MKFPTCILSNLTFVVSIWIIFGQCLSSRWVSRSICLLVSPLAMQDLLPGLFRQCFCIHPVHVACTCLYGLCMNSNTHLADSCLSQDVTKFVFDTFSGIFTFHTINEGCKQYSLLHTMFDYVFYCGPPGKHLYSSPPNQLHVGQLHVIGVLDLFIDVFLEVQNEKYS